MKDEGIGFRNCYDDFYIEPVPVEAREQFRAMAEAYWRDLMPDAAVCKSRESRDSFF